jgi:hypothetical protein
MSSTASLSDSDLLARLPALVHAERNAAADVIAHLMELERRRLYLDQACSSLYNASDTLRTPRSGECASLTWPSACPECWMSCETARSI